MTAITDYNKAAKRLKSHITRKYRQPLIQVMKSPSVMMLTEWRNTRAGFDLSNISLPTLILFSAVKSTFYNDVINKI